MILARLKKQGGTYAGHDAALAELETAHSSSTIAAALVYAGFATAKVAEAYAETLPKTATELGYIMIAAAGRDACLAGYLTDDPRTVGRLALQYGDINTDGTLN